VASRIVQVLPSVEPRCTGERRRMWLEVGESLDFDGIRLGLQRERQVGDEPRLVLVFSEPGGTCDLRPLSFLSNCGVTAVPLAVAHAPAGPDAVLLEIRAMDAHSTFPTRVVA
jgi:hypothetical protein